MALHHSKEEVEPTLHPPKVWVVEAVAMVVAVVVMVVEVMAADVEHLAKMELSSGWSCISVRRYAC